MLLKTDIMHTASNCVCACTLNPLNRVLLQLLLFPEELYLSQFDVSIRYGSSGSACSGGDHGWDSRYQSMSVSENNINNDKNNNSTSLVQCP